MDLDNNVGVMGVEVKEDIEEIKRDGKNKIKNIYMVKEMTRELKWYTRNYVTQNGGLEKRTI